jgi:RNA polymerase sigma-70 factor (ECF subfamily)
MPFEAPAAPRVPPPFPTERDRDAQLTRRAATGDRRALDEVMRRVLPRIRAVAQRMTRDAAEADDATQVAVLELWQHLATFNGQGSLLGWAKVLAWRRIARHLVHTRRQGAHERQFHNDADDPVDASDACDALLRRLELERLLQDTPTAQRHALVLHHGLGWSLDEVAHATGTVANTVKSRMRLALADLRARPE